VLLPCYVGTAVSGLAQLSPPLPELEGELWLLTRPDLRNTARMRAFLDFCADDIARYRRAERARLKRSLFGWRCG
jgi:DNA-binding transcriptional LysR family regulator